jgi:hypothetical protein
VRRRRRDGDVHRHNALVSVRGRAAQHHLIYADVARVGRINGKDPIHESPAASGVGVALGIDGVKPSRFYNRSTVGWRRDHLKLGLTRDRAIVAKRDVAPELGRMAGIGRFLQLAPIDPGWILQEPRRGEAGQADMRQGETRRCPVVGTLSRATSEQEGNQKRGEAAVGHGLSLSGGCKTLL